MDIQKRDVLKLMAGGVASSSMLRASSVRAGRSDAVLYENPLASAADVEGFVLEGSAHVTFLDGWMAMKAARPPEDGQDANFVLWCPEVFPADIEISWEFRPLELPGLCILFFAATGLDDGRPISLFDPRLDKRAGRYEQYTSSDVSYLSLSYFRRMWDEERRFQVVNLRSAPGFELLAQGADPIPSQDGIGNVYKLRVRRQGGRVTMFIEDLPVLDWTAPDGAQLPQAGHIGFRQMAPLKAEYSNLRVIAI